MTQEYRSMRQNKTMLYVVTGLWLVATIFNILTEDGWSSTAIIGFPGVILVGAGYYLTRRAAWARFTHHYFLYAYLLLLTIMFLTEPSPLIFMYLFLAVPIAAFFGDKSIVIQAAVVSASIQSILFFVHGKVIFPNNVHADLSYILGLTAMITLFMYRLTSENILVHRFRADEMQRRQEEQALREQELQRTQQTIRDIQSFIYQLEDVIHMTQAHHAQSSQHLREFQTLDVRVTDIREEMARLIHNTKQDTHTVESNSSRVGVQATETEQGIGEGVSILSDLQLSVSSLQQNMVQNEEAVQNLSQQLEHIMTLLRSVENIASQTDLLALNANIEAAKAEGDSGKGFGVVAGAVRDLSEQTKQLTDEMKDILQKTQRSMDSTKERVAEGRRGMGKTKERMEEILASIGRASEKSRYMKQAANENMSHTRHVHLQMESIEQQVQQMDAHAQEMNSIVDELHHSFEALKDAVGQLHTHSQVLQAHTK